VRNTYTLVVKSMKVGSEYDYDYYTHDCGPNPHDSDDTVSFFKSVAANIKRDFNPKTVLDVGCAMGHLVGALHDIGVEAYGIDVSEYAINRVRQDIKPFCQVLSIGQRLPSNFPQKFDLLVTIEVAEHLYEEESQAFVDSICGFSDEIIFSSTPSDLMERTHYNVQQLEYWAKRFATNGFYRNLTLKPSYILPHSVVFRRTNDIKRAIEDYERNLRILTQGMNILKRDFSNLDQDRHAAQKVMDTQAMELEHQRRNYDLLREDHRRAEEIIEAQTTELEQQRRHYELLCEDRRRAQEAMDSLATELERRRDENEHLREDQRRTQEMIDNQACQITAYKQNYESVLDSTSWRLTQPLRLLSNKLRRKNM
jgi:2-polyprenyl-3-methyl-5-hydroxy-6-metoxy-1,4-benzoquinol methylase